jgi:hypothetical protein
MTILKTLMLSSGFKSDFNFFSFLICDSQSDKNDLKTKLYKIL